MPIHSEWSPDNHTLAAIWEIDEPESFFTTQTGITTAIKHEKRRLEHLAGRYLLQYLKEDFPLHHIAADEHDKPRLPLNQYYFSISHSYPFVAVIISNHFECGIDIQIWHPRMEKLQGKFLAPAEQHMIGKDPRAITIAWCAKEAAYKWNGRRGIDFIEQLPIVSNLKNENSFKLTVQVKNSSSLSEINIKGSIFEDFALAYVINS